MDADKKKDWLKSSARKARIKKIKRKKAISGDVVQEQQLLFYDSVLLKKVCFTPGIRFT